MFRAQNFGGLYKALFTAELRPFLLIAQGPVVEVSILPATDPDYIKINPKYVFPTITGIETSLIRDLAHVAKMLFSYKPK